LDPLKIGTLYLYQNSSGLLTVNTPFLRLVRLADRPIGRLENFLLEILADWTIGEFSIRNIGRSANWTIGD
jgi:hypothetical protein